jgi:hypothetical protein
VGALGTDGDRRKDRQQERAEPPRKKAAGQWRCQAHLTAPEGTILRLSPNHFSSQALLPELMKVAWVRVPRRRQRRDLSCGKKVAGRLHITIIPEGIFES